MNVVMFYPRLGWMDAFVLDLPLSVIYASHECQRQGIEVRYIDQRVAGPDWRIALRRSVDAETVMVGFSVMSGSPLRYALEASRFCKAEFPDVPLVWGGMHVSILPETIAGEASIDYGITGLGSKPLYALAQWLKNPNGPLSAIPNLLWRDGGKLRQNPQSDVAEYPPLSELSFEGLDWSRYTRFNYEEKVYSLFTSFGCPHECGFCYAPIFWKSIKGRKWFPYDPEAVVDHVTKIVRERQIGYISLLDENFFLDLPRAGHIFRSLLDRGVRVAWGIRGARIDDLDRADDDFLALISEAGVRQIMIGAESGSARMLAAMKKGITVEQTIRVNQKLSRYPQLNPSYNFLSGLPGETVKDLLESVGLILRLMEDNPHASFSGLNQLMPFPGSEIYDRCVAGGYQAPTTLDGWARIDAHYNDSPSPWLDRKTQATLHAIQAALLFADKKVERELSADNQARSRGFVMDMIYKLIGLGARLYRPAALWRLRHRYFRFPLDYALIKFGVNLMHQLTRGAPTR